MLHNLAPTLPCELRIRVTYQGDFCAASTTLYLFVSLEFGIKFQSSSVVKFCRHEALQHYFLPTPPAFMTAINVVSYLGRERHDEFTGVHIVLIISYDSIVTVLPRSDD